MKYFWHGIGLVSMLAVGFELITLNFLWALSRSESLLNQGLAAQNPQGYATLTASFGPVKNMAIIFGIVAVIGILIWHLMRKRMEVKLWTGMFYVLIYAIATVVLLLVTMSSGAFSMLKI